MTINLPNLSRGTTLRVRQSFPKDEFRGTEVLVASLRSVRCHGAHRCAGSHCDGNAIFVYPATVTPDGDSGWLKNTTKICLTHLDDANGQPLLRTPLEPVRPMNGASVRTERQDTVVKALLDENDRLKTELIAAQREVIKLQRERLGMR